MEGDAQALNDLAWRALAGGDPAKALGYARRAHELSRRNPDYLNTLGVAHAESGDLAQAEAALRRAVKLKPDHVDAVVNLGKVLEKNEDLPGALKSYRHAYALAPRFPKLAATLARVYRECGRAADARALLTATDSEDLLIAAASCDFELDGEAAAIARLRGARPEWRAARQALAHLLLSTGHWREGWRLYRNAKPKIGAHVHLRGEQGIGDVLFFMRFVPMLRSRGVTVSIACEKKLLPILEGAREYRGEEAIPIGDLPLILDTEETPPAWPLAVPEKASLERFGPPPYLGVTWRAGTDLGRRAEFGNDPGALMKAIAPALLGRALRGWPGTLIVLQRGARAGELEDFRSSGGQAVTDLSPLGDDLPALLAVLAALDEYVGVSNANMHLLAGIGKTARVLVPYPGEWRWMRRAGPSPWFPGFELYRQPQSRDWSSALQELRGDLFKGRNVK
ncbi:MAG TPA: tetratricopeptide repeat protein [Burkholderiales bacterium]|jgi:cytochrome c-type biogenesis protein CcmH/NrfG